MGLFSVADCPLDEANERPWGRRCTCRKYGRRHARAVQHFSKLLWASLFCSINHHLTRVWVHLVVAPCGVLAVLLLRSPAVASSSVALVTSQGYCTSAKHLQDDNLIKEGPKKQKKSLQSSALPLSYSSIDKDETRIELMTTRKPAKLVF